MGTDAWGKTLPLQYDNVAKFSRKRPPELTFYVLANGKVRLWWLHTLNMAKKDQLRSIALIKRKHILKVFYFAKIPWLVDKLSSVT